MRVFLTVYFSWLLAVFIPSDYAIAQRNTAVTNFDRTDSTQGLLIYSISTTKPAYSSYYLEVYHLESRKKEKLELLPFREAEIKSDSIKVHYRAIMLPSGDYKIYGWGMTYNYGSGQKTFFPMGNFGLPFTVFGGRINYLGDYLGTTSLGRNVFGIKIPSGGYFIVSNRFEEDYEAIINKWPNLDLNGILNSMPDFSENKPIRSLMFLKGINIP